MDRFDLSIVLIGLASVLVDASFDAPQYQDRLWAQILLWLTASLVISSSTTANVAAPDENAMNNDNDVHTDMVTATTTLWLHTIFLGNLLSVFYKVTILRLRPFSWNSQDYSRFISISAWMALVAATAWSSSFFDWFLQSDSGASGGDNNGANGSITTQQKSHPSPLLIFAMTFLTLSAYTWHNTRQRQRRREFDGIPIVMPNATSIMGVRNSRSAFGASTFLEEDTALWYNWKPSQVLHWIATLQPDWQSSVCRLLAPECIDGTILDTIRLEDFRSMGVAYGHAKRLSMEIETFSTHLSTASATTGVSTSGGNGKRQLVTRMVGRR